MTRLKFAELRSGIGALESASNVLDKAAQALALLRNEMPRCCKRQVVPSLADRGRTE